MARESVAAELVREARHRAALSQRELAERAGTAQSVVGRIESGQSSPTVETLANLLDAAGFELDAELIPRRDRDPVIELYKRDIDQTLLVENLRESVDERLLINARVLYFTDEARRSLRVAEGKP